MQSKNLGRACESLAGLLREIECEVPAEDLAARSPAERRAARRWAEAIAMGEGTPPARPDWLEAYDVRRCHRCGCTDAHGCEDGCFWVDDDLCSLCDDGGEVPDAR